MNEFAMQTAPTGCALDRWTGMQPRLSGEPEQDANHLTVFTSAGDALVAQLAPKPLRDASQRQQASTIHEICRALRHEFLGLHAAWLYDRLTEGYRKNKRLEELVRDAALLCPGLAPSAEQMRAEARLRQAEKEGYEADQGLFFHALLSRPVIAAHMLSAMQYPTARALEMLPSFSECGRAEMEAVTIERRGTTAHLTITNAHCLNAEDLTHVEDMETAVDLALLDGGVHVCVLRGGEMTHPRYAGRRVFSAGVNLKALDAGQIPLVEFFLGRELGYINKIMRGLLKPGATSNERPVEKPWLGVVDTFAIGGGAQLLLAFDRVVAARDSYVSLPAAQEGIVPGFANLRLSRFLGNRLAQEVILGGRVIRATDMEAPLLLSRVADAGELETAIAQAITELDNPAVIANRRMLTLADEPVEQFLRYAAEFALEQSTRIYSRDVLENVHRAASRRSA